MGLNKRLLIGGAAEEAFDPLKNFETVTYTGNGGTQKITGYIRKGAAFNGSSSKIVNAGFNAITGNAARSISFWYKTTSDDDTIVTLGGTSGGNNTQFSIAPSSNSLAIYGFAGAYDESITGWTNDLTSGEWTHLVVTWDGQTGGTLKAYLNGDQEIKTLTRGAGEVYATTAGLQLGNWGNNDRYYNGKLDQVRIFDKALSQQEVTTLYNETYASSTKSTTDIFNDGSGVSLYELDEDANSSNFGQAAVFNGSSSKIDISLNRSSYSEISYSAWIKTSNTSQQRVIDSLDTTQVSNKMGLYTRFDGTRGIRYSSIGDDLWDTGDLDNLLGDWFHVSVTDGGGDNVTVYINGQSESITKVVSNNNYNTPTTTTIGVGKKSSNVTGDYFNGQLDQVRIYNTALSSGDVTKLYNESFDVPTSNLVAHYKLDGNATDETGSYDGTESSITYSTGVYGGTPTNVNFLGMAFQPDLVWIKNRDYNPTYNLLFDSVRGATKWLSSNATVQEGTIATSLTSFDSNGFSLGADPSGANEGWNRNGNGHVAWCWKAGGDYVLNEQGSIDSQVSANPDAGFSIVSYTGGGGVDTVGHGLSSTPELMFIKNRSRAVVGAAYHTGINSVGYLFASAAIGAEQFNSSRNDFMNNNTPPTNTVFTVRSYDGAGNDTQDYVGNYTGDTYIAYCFHSVDGYQKVGSYSGGSTGSSNEVSTGFSPRFLMIKRTDTTGQWLIHDTVRGEDRYLYPNLSNDEDGPDDIFNFTSNGFYFNGTNADWNASGGTYIYLAIA